MSGTCDLADVEFAQLVRGNEWIVFADHEANAIATAGAGPSSPMASATIVSPADRRMRPVRTCTWSPNTPSTASEKNSQSGRQSAARVLAAAPAIVTKSRPTAT